MRRAVKLPPLVDGLMRFSHVDGKLYRAGRYNTRGLDSIVRLHNVVLVVDLRDRPPLFSTRTFENAGLAYYSVPHASDEVVKFDTVSRLVDAGGKVGNVLVHCWRGANRTGAFVVRWRVERCGWSVEDAVSEAYQFGCERQPHLLRHLAGLS